MKKVKHQKNFKLTHEGKVWTLDLAEWRDTKTGKGQLRVYRVDGDITNPLLREALELEATVRGLNWSMGQ